MGKKILLADDSITIQKVIELTFSDEDFDVVTVGNGRLAVERIQEVQPDIVLCDIIMPEKDGYEVCEFVKKNPATAQVPVLLLTGAFEPFDQDRATRVGSDGYLAKPFEPQTLISKVKELLGRPARSVAPPAPVAAAAAPKPPSPPPLPPLPHAAPPAPPVHAAPPAPPAVAPPVPGLGQEPEVTFIPEEPYADVSKAEPAGVYAGEAVYSPEAVYTTPVQFQPEPSASGGEGEPATLDADFYQPAEAPSGGMPELVADEEGVGAFIAEEPMFAGEELVAEPSAGAPAGEAGVRWAQPTAEVSWEERAQAVSGSGEAGPTPVFEDVFEAPGAAEAPAAGQPGSEGEPMLLEYEPTFEPQLEPEAAPVAEQVPSVPTARDLFEEQGMAFEAEERAAAAEPRLEAPAPAVPALAMVAEPPASAMAPPASSPAPAPPAESFAELRPAAAAVTAPAPASPSVAGDVSVPVDMVAQIAQRVVAQMTEKVVREVAWEILPDLAEALIKKEIERLTAELKEP